MNKSFKRVWSVFLAVLMVFTMIPTVVFTASAATSLSTSVKGLTVTWEYTNQSGGSATWTSSGNTVTGKATGSTLKTNTSKVTFKNNLGTEAKLKFEYSYSNGTLGGDISNGSSSYEGVLSDGASVSITYKSPRGGKTGVLSITDISLVSTTAADSTIVCKAPVNGSYAVDGVAVTTETSKTVAGGTGIKLKATASSGYQFLGWFDEKSSTYLSYDATSTIVVSEDVIIKPVFISESVAVFGVGTLKFDNLTEAGKVASVGTNKTIVLLNNGTVSGEHVIPVGTTLLIPYDDANTVYGSKPKCTSKDAESLGIITYDKHIAWVKPTAYRTMTLANGANIIVNGNIEVSGQHAAAGGTNGMYGGSPTGPLGYINMNKGSHIELKSGANLYCWGYIYGDGTITAKNGANIYENFQIMDFRGGSVTSALATEFLVFPLSQYYVQNVEVATTYEYGSVEYIATSIFMSNMCHSATVKFIGGDAMFQPESGSYLVKDYNPTTDSLELDVYGNCSLSSMKLELGGEAIDSSKFILPITNNIQIALHSGITTLKQNIMMLPGSSLTIGKEATLNLAYTDVTGDVVTTGGYVLQVFDSENWTQGLNRETFEVVTETKYVHPARQFRPLQYTATAKKTRAEADLKDVKMDINGKIITNGFLYSTVVWKDAYNEDYSIVGGGANIVSSEKTGMVVMNSGAGTDMLSYMYDQSKASYYYIPIASAQLKNGGINGSTYLDTTGAEPGTVFNYCASHDMWYTGECEKCNSTFEITWKNEAGENLYTEALNKGETPVFDNNKAVAPLKVPTGHPFIFSPEITKVTTDAEYTVSYVKECKDINKDHKCDYGCGYASSCSDVNNDHKCDFCSETISCHLGTLTSVEGKAATCGDDGWNSYYECSCGKLYADNQGKSIISDLDAWKKGAGRINATGKHTPGTAVKENEKTPTCGETGYYDSVVYCTVCEDKLSSTPVTVPATGKHIDSDGDKNHDCDNCPATNVTVCKGGDSVKEKVVNATCDAEGSYDVVVYCKECGKELTRDCKVEDKKDHDWSKEITYSWSEDGKTCTATRVCASFASHNETETLTAVGAPDANRPATCMAKGWTVYTADFINDWAGIATTERQDVSVVAHTPGETVIENKTDSTCYAEGSYDEVVYCSVCKAAGKTEELSRVNKTIEKKNHTPAKAVVENKVESTCYEEGSYDEVVYCSVCDAKGIKEELSRKPNTIEKKKHTPAKAVVENKVESTCYEEGSYDEVVYCSVCKDAGKIKEISRETKKIDKKKHTPAESVTENFEDSTCYAEGSYDEVVYCSVCKDAGKIKEISRETKKIDKKKHTPAESVTENFVDSTCYAEGSYDEVVYCSVCKDAGEIKEISRETKKIDKKKHTPAEAVTENFEDSTCYAEGSYDEVVYCSVCDAKGIKEELSRETKKIDKKAHTRAEAVTENFEDSTCYAEGSYDEVVYCSVCEAKGIKEELSRDNKTIEKKKHTDLDGDGDHKCDNCPETNINECVGGEAVEEVITNATCDAEGSYDVVVYCKECGKELTRDCKVEGKKDHDWSKEITYSWSVDGKTCTATRVCASFASHNETETVTAVGAPDAKRTATCTEMGWTIYTADFINDWAGIATTERQDIEELGHGTKEGFTYTDLGDGNHSVTCNDCEAVTEERVVHSYDEDTHECVCKAVEEFELTIEYVVVYDDKTWNHEKMTVKVPYGANIYDELSKYDFYETGEKVFVDDPYGYKGELEMHDWLDLDAWVFIDENSKMPAKSLNICQEFGNFGWEYFEGLGLAYYDDQKFDTGYAYGWTYIEEDYDGIDGGAWYYFEPEVDEYGNEFGIRKEGISRVPYPEKEIDGVKYEADEETLKYYEGKGKSFIDADTGLFLFDNDGKFLNGFTGLKEYKEAIRYVKNGFIPWNPGVVEIIEDIYYFIGDEKVGGNAPADGDIYITRTNGADKLEKNSIYNFENGQLSGADGIVDGKYYEDSKLMVGNGLTKLGDKYIYVRSNGEIVADAEYWIGANKLNIVPGLYAFDAEGYMLNVKTTEKNGIYFENGAYYYYENGVRAYAGLINYTGKADNGTVYDNDWIYVRSSGQLATGEYWTTKNETELKTQTYLFDETGKMIRTDGIIEENGNLYYYVSGIKQKGSGLIELDGKYYYVRTAGELVRSREYWITNVNDTGVVAQNYYFDGNGVMQDVVFDKDEAVNGVVDGYYYENGKVVCGAGLVELSDGSIIYVRSNGQLATGIYWPTTLNGILPAGKYDFGTDGILVIK